MKKELIPTSQEIVYLKGVQNYTEFHLRNGRKLISSYTLIHHQNNFGGFLRVSKSHLLNPIYILQVNDVGPEKEVLLKSGMSVRVSRRRKQVLASLAIQ